eukprot:TRINITY_DN75501_c0_g1_i1.p1 TRINITY_DN75501_c0_g1~~TRINITY_DN75501_c0_g1_i1.p1  ORF type:complete len:263 (-),score=32.85 TRINITY_DN75501_c0_g1_i1:43-759(-)
MASNVLAFSPCLRSALERKDWAEVLAITGRNDTDEGRCLYARPLTMLWALTVLSPNFSIELKIPGTCSVLVGAAARREETLVAAGAFELIAELVPEIQWRLLFVGPGLLDEHEFIPERQVEVRFIRGHIHDACVQRALEEEHFEITVLFNSGIGCDQEHVSKPWRRSLPILIRFTLVLFTSFSEDEAIVEQGAIGDHCDDVGGIGDIHRNPFASEKDSEGPSQPGRSYNKVLWWLRRK